MVTLIAMGVLLVPILIVGGVAALIWRRRRLSILKWSLISYLGLVFLVIFGVGPYLAAWTITHSGTRLPDRQLKDTPSQYGISYEEVAFPSKDSLRLRGWFIPPKNKNTILICTHGLFRNRVEMLARVVPSVQAGYGALLYDARSHGTSERAITSLGYYERNDVLGAILYLRHRYQDAAEQPGFVLFGVSMGAVATLEAAAETDDYSALVLDSAFGSLKQAVMTHTWLLLKLPRYSFPPLFLYWLRQMAAFEPERVDAHRVLQKVEPVPVLFISSEGDERIGPDVARQLYRESQSSEKRIEIFGKDVPHGASARIYPERYGALLLDFLEKINRTDVENMEK
jgi:pimeloyl-ACP methyl ester carboxylesterase